MKALLWDGPNHLRVDTVPDPTILRPHDAIVRVHLSTACGSDLHLLDGYVPTMEKGDVIGHEFIGEIVETGSEVRNFRAGDRVIVISIIGCGQCWFCQNQMFSLCDNTNPNAWIAETAYGHSGAGIFGYSHAFGGYPGSHAQYVRIPFVDVNAFNVPDGVSDDSALFCSDAFPTGFMAADLCDLKPGSVVAVWGAGGVGLMAMISAYLLGAEQVIAIDRFSDRLEMARKHAGAVTLNYEELDVLEALGELTGGRGPDACIDCVGMEAHGTDAIYAIDKAKQQLRLETGRPTVLRQMIMAARKGGVISVIGVYGGLVDGFPMGALMNKALTMKSGQQHGQRYAKRLLQYVADGKVDPSFLITNRMPLDEAPRGYEMFKHKTDGCVRPVFTP